MRRKRCGGRKHLHGHRALALEDDARLVFHLTRHHLAEHAFPHVVIVAQRLVQAVPHLAWDYRRRNQLRVRMLQARPRIHSVILENRNVIHSMIEAQRVVALFIDAQNAGHIRIGQQSHVPGVVRTVDDHFVKAEPGYAPPQVLQAARGLHLTRQRRELVWDHAHFPTLSTRRIPQHFLRRLAFIARTKWTILDKRGHRLRCTMRGQLLGPLGPFRGNDDPFLGEEVLP